MKTEIITLIAALIAAITSLINILISVIAGKYSEFRSAHRKSLQSYIEPLGKELHQILATSNVYIERMTSGESQDKWVERATEATNNLKELRWSVRYPLWGVDEGIRTLTRLFDWLTHLQ